MGTTLAPSHMRRTLRRWLPGGCAAQRMRPVLALLQRRLTEDVVYYVAGELASSGELPVDAIDIRVAITGSRTTCRHPRMLNG